MNRTRIVRPQAWADLNALVDFVAVRNPSAAIRLSEAAEATIQRLVNSPEIGERYATDRPECREWRFRTIDGFHSYLIVYRTFTDGVEIMRVFHGAQDWQAIL